MSPLRIVDREGLGQATIMDVALAAKHGAKYVRLAAFAIDIDRILDEAELTDPRPPAWEVFLTEVGLFALLDRALEEDQLLLEDLVLALVDEPADPRLGDQIVFAVHDAVHRQRWDAGVAAAFSRWRKPSRALTRDLDRLFESEARFAAELARSCVETHIDPPLAPTTLATLRALMARER